MDAQAAPAAFTKSFAGDGLYIPLLEGPPQTCGMRSGRVLLKQGEDCGEHTTGAHEECLVVLEGRGEARVKGREPLAIEAGRVVYIPPHTTHCVHNVDCPVLRYVYVVAPVTSSEDTGEH
jgi:mannose-6-phosphate isomerase-like protein (cupin superfamily)